MLDELLEIILLDAEEHMEKSLSHLRKELSAIRAGRATPAMLQTVRVDYYGSRSPLNQVSTISSPQPDLLVVSPWDKSAMGAIEKAIQSANLGLNPSNDGTLIRVPVPPLSGERRQNLCRRARRLAEESKIAIRNIRRHAKEQIKSTQEDEKLSEDMRYHAEDELQKGTNRYVEKVDTIIRRKEAEILDI